MRLDQVLVIADASRIETLIEDRRVGDTVRNQFAKCDVVLLSKRDLVIPDALNAARTAVQALRPDVRIDVLSRGLSSDRFLAMPGEKSSFRADGIDDDALDHEEGFRRWTYRRDGSFDRERLACAIGGLPMQLLRLKGACRIAGDRTPLLLQMVGGDWSLSPAEFGNDFESITLVGVGTADLPPDGVLEAILDGALT